VSSRCDDSVVGFQVLVVWFGFRIFGSGISAQVDR